ncbi:MAG: DUF4760 domain-containing protein [Thermoplasmata archaeon]|nr:DUF4760 domain-containing protein [Thermoplasmata archaeon]
MVDLSNLALWTAVGAWVLAIGTLFLMYWQTRESRRLNSANTVMGLREKFDSARMRVARRHLSERLLAGKVEDVTNLDVLNFFELVGAQTFRKILDEEMVWEAFGNWVTSYYAAVRQPDDLIGRLRQTTEDPLIFGKLEWLNERIIRRDRRELGAVHVATVHVVDEGKIILKRESHLGPD